MKRKKIHEIIDNLSLYADIDGQTLEKLCKRLEQYNPNQLFLEVDGPGGGIDVVLVREETDAEYAARVEAEARWRRLERERQEKTKTNVLPKNGHSTNG